jgi:hypothetical protein
MRLGERRRSPGEGALENEVGRNLREGARPGTRLDEGLGMRLGGGPGK